MIMGLTSYGFTVIIHSFYHIKKFNHYATYTIDLNLIAPIYILKNLHTYFKKICFSTILFVTTYKNAHNLQRCSIVNSKSVRELLVYEPNFYTN